MLTIFAPSFSIFLLSARQTMPCWTRPILSPIPVPPPPCPPWPPCPPCRIPPMPARDICLSAYAPVTSTFFFLSSDQSKLVGRPIRSFPSRPPPPGITPNGHAPPRSRWSISRGSSAGRRPSNTPWQGYRPSSSPSSCYLDFVSSGGPLPPSTNRVNMSYPLITGRWPLLDRGGHGKKYKKVSLVQVGMSFSSSFFLSFLKLPIVALRHSPEALLTHSQVFTILHQVSPSHPQP